MTTVSISFGKGFKLEIDCEDLEHLKFNGMTFVSIAWHLKRMAMFRLPSLASLFLALAE